MDRADVLLVNPSFYHRQEPIIKARPWMSVATLPLGILCLAAYLEENGVRVEVIDTRLYGVDETLQKIKGHLNHVSIVGLSVMTAAIPEALRISDFVKSHDNNIKVVWGGIHPTLFPIQTVDDKSVDFAVRGEGEIPILQLANCLKYGKPQLKEIPSLVYKNVEEEIITNDRADFLDLNLLPFPAYHLLEIDKYLTRMCYDGRWVRVLEIQTSRGCPHRCAFCVNSIVSGCTWRPQNPRKSLDHLDRLVTKYKLDCVVFLDENFFPDKKRVKAILEGLIEGAYDVEWIADCRADYFSPMHIDENLLNLMEKSGCKGLFIGAESGSQKILDMLKKDITVAQIMNAVRECSQHDIQPYISIMMGLPQETKEDLIATLGLMWELKKICPKLSWSGPQLFRPYPGGELYEVCKQKGLEEPKNLRSWQSFVGTLTGYIDVLPWVSVDVQFILDIIQYINLASLGDQVKHFGMNFLKKGAIMSLARIAKLRWERSFWSAPFEARIIQLIRARRMSQGRYLYFDSL